MIKNFFYIALRKIKSFAMGNRFIFIMFLLGSVACSLMFLYFWGNLRHTIDSYQAVSYTAILQEPGEIDVADMFNTAKKYRARIDAICIPGNSAVGGPAVESFLLLDETIQLGFLCTNRSEEFYMWGCEWVELEEIGTVIVPDAILLGADMTAAEAGIVLMGKPMKIIGRTASRFFFLSIVTFREYGLIPTEIHITLPSDLSEGEKKVFFDTFCDEWGTVYSLQDTTKVLPLKDLLAVMLPMLLVYLLCMFSMLYILVYFLESMAFELSVYGLLGASNKMLIWIPAVVQGLLLAIAGGLACALHAMLYVPLFSHINLYEFAYSPLWYVEATVLTLILSFSVMLLYLKHRVGKYVVVNFRNNLQ